MSVRGGPLYPQVPEVDIERIMETLAELKEFVAEKPDDPRARELAGKIEQCQLRLDEALEKHDARKKGRGA